MEFLLTRYRNLTVLLVVILSQLLLLAYQVKTSQDVRLLRTWTVRAVTPLAKVVEVVRRNTIGFIDDYLVLINVREQNRRLSDQVGKLKLENQDLRNLLQTADRLKALATYQAKSPSRMVPARIIGSGTGFNSKVVFVDEGDRAGVQRGMAVITPDGIVGKVLNSFPNAAQVMLITDPNFAAGVISQKNRVHGILRGQTRGTCGVDMVQNQEKVEQGEMFFTSGDDRVFPKGLPVGTVSVVAKGPLFQSITLTPSGFATGLEEVLIVIEGVHQDVPNPATASKEVSLLAPPKPDPVENPDPAGVMLNTDADRLRERYKRIGEAQNHVYGEGAPGSRPPNFNIEIDKKQAAAPPAKSKPGPAGSSSDSFSGGQERRPERVNDRVQ